MGQPGPSQLLTGQNLALTPVIGLEGLAYLQLAPPAVPLHPTGQILSTRLHYCKITMVRLCSHRTTLQQMGPLQLPMCLKLALALAAGPGPHH